MKVTILGCGASGGVPLIGGNWGDCDPGEPRNRRRRSSILVQSGETTVLVDASPDCRAQLLDANIGRLDAIVFTHAHADHTHGMDDLRWVNVAMRSVIPAYARQETLEHIETRFGYAFAPLDPAAEGFFYKPCLEPRPIRNRFSIGDLEITAFDQDHGFGASTGLRIGRFAYSVDVVRLDEHAFDVLDGVEYWVVGCLGLQPHPTHAHLDRVLEWIDRIRPRKVWLSHMSHKLDYAEMRRRTPDGVEPAFDGLVIEVP